LGDFRCFWIKTNPQHITNFPHTTPPKTTTKDIRGLQGIWIV